MERASRLIVIASIVLAGATHAWLAIWQPALPAAAAAAFAVTFLIAQFSLPYALAVVFGLAYLAPALLYVTLGASDYHLTLVWLAALAGPVLAHGDLARWHLPSRWRLPLIAWAMVLALTWPIVAGRELDFSFIAARTYDTTNAMFDAPPCVAAAWIAIVALAQMIGILWIDLLWARFSGPELVRVERFVMLPVVASAAIGAVAGLYQALVHLEWMNPGIWPALRRATGLMLEANTFGIGAAIWAPVAVVLAWRLRQPVWLGALGYVLIAAGMWTSGSRTAFLAWTVGTCGLGVALLQRKGYWQPRMAQIVLLLGAGALVLAMAIAPRGGNSPSPLQRTFDRLPRLNAAELQQFADEMWNRFGYGRAAALAISDHPLTGVGIGSFHVVLNDYYYRATGRTLRPDNAQNWWRHQIAELGLVGALPSLWISLVIILLVWHGGPETAPLGVTAVLRMVIVGVGVASALGVPTQHPATWISLVTIAFWLAALYGTAADEGGRALESGVWTVTLAMALMTVAGQAASARGDLRVPVRALEDGVRYRYGLTPPEGVSQYGPLRWAARHAVEVMPVERPWLQFAVWAPDTDVASNPVTVRVWLNQRQVVEHVLNTPEPLRYIVQIPENQTWLMLEVSASRSTDAERALRIAHDWLADVPTDVPPEHVIR